MLGSRDTAQKKASKFHRTCDAVLSDFNLLEEADEMQENSELSTAIASVQEELTTITDATSIVVDDTAMNFSFQTKSGKMYSPAIRKLYYALLADQIPPAKIASTIKAILKCFLTNLDVEQLILPKERCAGCMRREELKTISMAHKATVITEHVKKGLLHMNTDGTTKAQRKLGGVAINGMVVSVNELPDGTADSVIKDVSQELEKLRETARALKMSNPDSINWSVLVSSTSDSASTQKRFNKLMDQCREEDERSLDLLHLKLSTL